MKAKAPTVSEIVEAYHATGLRPMRHSIDAGPFCCAVGALAAVAGIRYIQRYEWARNRYGFAETQALIDGFDGNVNSGALYKGRLRKFYNVGRKVFKDMTTELH